MSGEGDHASVLGVPCKRLRLISPCFIQDVGSVLTAEASEDRDGEI